MIEVGRLVAIVSDTPRKRLRPSRANMLRYHETLQYVQQRCLSILPVRFGTITSDEAELEELLREQCTQFREALTYLTGKREIGLKISWPSALLFQVVQEREPELAQLANQTLDIATRIAIGKRVEKGINLIHQETTAQTLSRLANWYEEARQEQPLDDKMSLNASFLIPMAQIDSFLAELERYESEISHLIFKVSGPFPPYSFVDITMSSE